MCLVDVVIQIQGEAAHYKDHAQWESSIVEIMRAHNREVAVASATQRAMFLK